MSQFIAMDQFDFRDRFPATLPTGFIDAPVTELPFNFYSTPILPYSLGEFDTSLFDFATPPSSSSASSSTSSPSPACSETFQGLPQLSDMSIYAQSYFPDESVFPALTHAHNHQSHGLNLNLNLGHAHGLNGNTHGHNHSHAPSHSHSHAINQAQIRKPEGTEPWTSEPINSIGYRDEAGKWRCAFPRCRSLRVFTRVCDLRKHYQGHNKVFFCYEKHCQTGSIGFSSRKDYIRHLRSHEPAIKCSHEGCLRVFSRKDNMREHYKKIHLRGRSDNFSRQCRRIQRSDVGSAPSTTATTPTSEHNMFLPATLPDQNNFLL